MDIQKYCENPYRYNLDSYTTKYYNTICSLRKKAGKKKIDLKKLGEAVPEGIVNLVEGMLSPESIALLGVTMGVIFSLKAAYVSMTKFLVRGVDPLITAGIEGVANITAANASKVVAGFVSTITIENFSEYAGRYALAFVLETAELLGNIIDVILVIQLVLQVVGMIFDEWDPCGLKEQMNSKSLRLFSQKFNEVFNSKIVTANSSFRDSFGTVYEIYRFPIEYYLENGILLQDQKEKYDKLQTELIFKYINAIRVNSDGEIVNWPKTGKNIDNKTLKTIANDMKSLSMFIAGNNTIIANIFLRY